MADSRVIRFCFGEFDVSVYRSLPELLQHVWSAAFQHWDGCVETNKAADMATKAQDTAEMAWRAWFDRPLNGQTK